MKKIDKTALLFEMLLGTDMYNVNRKIEEIKVSKEYIRVSNFVPELANSQIAYDIKEKFEQLDVFGVLSMKRILEVERQINELDRRIRNFPTVNPYLSTGAEKEYNINKLGDINIEVSSEGMTLSEFANKEGISEVNRRKFLKTKMFSWYKEAKQGLVDNMDNSKLMLSKVRRSKFNVYCMNLECVILVLATIGFTFLLFFTDFFNEYIAKTLPVWQQIVVTLGYYVTLIGTVVSVCAVAKYKSYPFYVASDLRRQVIEQGKLVKQLEDKAYELEKKVINRKGKVANKLDYDLSKLCVTTKRGKLTTSELFDYVYSEKEFYLERRKGVVLFNNIIFAITIVISVLAMFLLVVF